MIQQSTIETVSQSVCAKIAPLWPLKNFVAVNPFLGFTDKTFQETAQILTNRSSIRMTMPLEFFLEKMQAGEIKTEDIAEKLVENGYYKSVEEFIAEAKTHAKQTARAQRFKTFIDVAPNGEELNQIMVDAISFWSGAYFDQFQALWRDSSKSILSSWIDEARFDRTPEIAGIPNFRKVVGSLPHNTKEIIALTAEKLELEDQQLEAYLHTLLLKTIGWSSYVAGLDWNNRLYSEPTKHLEEFLCILLTWEYAAAEAFGNNETTANWQKEKANFEAKDYADQNSRLFFEIILQEAFDRSHQNGLIEKINAKPTEAVNEKKSKIQSVFCIDVRSEVMRRNIESVNPAIETIGFAGFFGFPIKFRPTEIDLTNNQCPVLIPSGPLVAKNHGEKTGQVEQMKAANNQFMKTWKGFKTGAISAFSFVSPLGIFFLPKLIKESFQISTKGNLEKPENNLLDLSHIALNDQIDMAANALKLIGIRDNLADLVLFVGHGSTSKNNPHASGLECGACGGYSGKNNALTAVQVLNSPEVRKGLEAKGIAIPDHVFFVGALHDTTSDEISCFPTINLSEEQQNLLNEATKSFAQASAATRMERSARFDVQPNQADLLVKRGQDWSQVRPEWGLAGCSSFIIGDRRISEHANLGGRSFLHNYDWKKDTDKSVLELIMTAPMVVTSWINLQYYASVVDNNNFGAGNKTLHNVTGGFGVIEGSGGDLKTGLAFQSVHDGDKLQHMPNKLAVFIQAPHEAINSILEKHPSVQHLFDNKWLTLYGINDAGMVTSRYVSDRNWESISNTEIKESNTVKTVEYAQ